MYMKSVLGLSLAFSMFASPVVRAELPDTVGLREIATAGTNDQTLTVTGTHLIEGVVRKTGSGAWTVPAATVFSGSRAAWDVLAGSVALTGIGAGSEMELAAAPTAVLNQAAFWVAADENVIYADNGGVNEVSAWLDVREPDTAAPYVYTRAVSKTNFTNAVPELMTSGAGPDSSLPYLWFGGYHSGRWMDWTDPSDASRHLNTIHHAFVVHGTHDSYGYFLGITESDSTTYPLDFRKDDYASATGTEGMIWENAAYGYTATALRTGRTFLNRARVDGATTPVPRGYQLIGAEVGCRPANAGNFFNCRNLFPGTGARVGGDRLCEAVIFTNRLSETDRIKVEHYLWQKWFGRAPQSPAGLNVAAGATATFDWDAAGTLDFQTQGDGRLVKQGVGGLRMAVDNRTPLSAFNGSLTLEGGEIDARLPVPVAVTGGNTYSNEAMMLYHATAAAGKAVKVGSGELVISSVPADVTLEVREGLLNIAQPMTAAFPSEMRGTIPNPTFEGLVSDGTVYNLAANETVGGWTAFDLLDAGSIRIGADDQWYYLGNPLLPFPTPDGKGYLLIKKRGSVRATVTLPAGGVYALSFLASGRKYDSARRDGHAFDIIIDNTCTVATAPTFATDWQRYRYLLPYLPAGEHTLTLKTVSGSSDYASALDDFRLDLVSRELSENVISNACFECVTGDAKLMAHTAAPGWTFGNAGSGGSASVCSGGPLLPVYDAASPRIIQGSSSNNLQEAGRRNLFVSGDGNAATTVTFPAAGEYTLALRACRTRFGPSDWSGASELTVTVDGCVTQTMSTYRDVFQDIIVGPFTAPAGQPLALTLQGTAGKCLMLIDDLRVCRADNPDSLIQNGSFEQGGTPGWTTNGWEVYIPAGTEPIVYATTYEEQNNYGYAFGITLFDGVGRCRIASVGYARQTVTFAQPGTYRLAMHAISRIQRNPDTYAETRGRNPIRIWLARNGVTNTLGYVTTYDEAFRRHEYLFTVPEAGAYVLSFDGQSTVDRTSLIDDISIMAVDADTAWTPFAKGSALEISDGARVLLNFSGEQRVDTLRYNGVSLTGVIDSSTHPDVIMGTGQLYAMPKGTLIRVY